MRRLIVLLIVLMPSVSWAMEKFVDFVQDNRGNIITGVSVTVYTHGTTNKATIYSDNGLTLKSNPFNNATDGTVQFYAANGRYDLVYSKVGVSFTSSNTTDRVLFDSVDFAGGGGGGVGIGNAVTSGSPSSFLYVAAGPVLAQASLTGLVLGNGASAPTAYTGTTCTNQVVRVLSAAGAATCVTITSAYVDSSILTTGATVTFAQGGTGLSSALDDTVMVSSGTAWVAKLIADCQDSGGNHLNYTQSSNSFSCGTSGGITIGNTVTSGVTQNMLYVDSAGKLAQLSLGTGQVPTLIAGALVAGTINAADPQLDNLSSVAINTALLPGSAGTIDLGSSTKPWEFLWLSGASGTPGTNNFKLTGTATAARTLTLPDATDTLTGKATTDTLTNKTYDAEGTGNVLSLPIKKWLPAAGCNNATAGTVWDLPTSTPAVPTCVTGTNIQKGVLAYADTSGGFSAQITEVLPSDWTTTGGVDAKIFWTTSATSGNAKWTLSTICTDVAATATDDPVFNNSTSVTTAAPGSANQVQTSSITGVAVAGCTTATTMLLHLKLFRDGNDAADTISATANVIGVLLTYRRAI